MQKCPTCGVMQKCPACGALAYHSHVIMPKMESMPMIEYRTCNTCSNNYGWRAVEPMARAAAVKPIKPEEVKLYAYEIHNHGVAFFLFDTGAADRRPEYDLVFKGE